MATSDVWDVNPHLALAQSESYVSPSERAWDRFVAQVEKLIGHDLDGDQDRDGYSIDFAHDCFRDGWTAQEYALEVQAEKAARATGDVEGARSGIIEALGGALAQHFPEA